MAYIKATRATAVAIYWPLDHAQVGRFVHAQILPTFHSATRHTNCACTASAEPSRFCAFKPTTTTSLPWILTDVTTLPPVDATRSVSSVQIRNVVAHRAPKVDAWNVFVSRFLFEPAFGHAKHPRGIGLFSGAVQSRSQKRSSKKTKKRNPATNHGNRCRMADMLGELLRILAELLFRLALAIFVAIPASGIAFVYGLATRRSVAEAFVMAGKVAASILEFTLSV